MRSIIVLAVAAFAFAPMLLVDQAGAAPEEGIPGAVPAVLPIKPVEIADGEEELRRLLKKRYNAVAAEVRDLYALYKGGRTRLSDICLAIEKFADAGSELAETPAARVRELESAREAARAVETLTHQRQLNEQEPDHASSTPVSAAWGLKSICTALAKLPKRPASQSEDHPMRPMFTPPAETRRDGSRSAR